MQHSTPATPGSTSTSTSTDARTPTAPERAWTEHVIWWHVYPLGFGGADTTGADRSPQPRLLDLVPWLDHLLALGANGLALGPVFASSTHGYDTIDWLRVDPRLGTDDDLVTLIDAAHSKGVRVMLDGVFNHVGPEFPALQEARADSSSPAAALFRRDEHGELATFEGHGGLIALDHSSPEVVRLVSEVIVHWADRGADAWRLDAAYSVPSSFWAEVLPPLRESHPDVWVVGEVLHGDYAAAVRDGGLDSVTQYELWQGTWHGIQDVNLHELAWALTRHDEFLDEFAPLTFVGNHDVTRIASQIDDERHHAHAVVLLFTLGGVPSVYYGDELGLRAVKEERVGGDDAIRPAFPRWSGDDAVGTDAGADAVSLVAGADPAVLALHQEMVGVRRRHPWLHGARTRTVSVTNETLVLEVRGAAAGADGADELLLVALNLGDEPLRVADPAPAADGWVAGRDAGLDGDVLVVGAHGWAVVAPRA
ncbi:alpha-amylase family glycosyl hydrolase [Frigoribacterium sp. PhB116]|uniref:alpha-amylase family glycosyl hydrolase n=1 Tax=Frigoribacterium sp. PhB116 TaxID=2485174 RepID=UPI00105F1FA7|nr:alpha-amylase family glycosyl hydrolase [Frigoribacterium sp. PhB116]TDT62538.1 cyclomaltodextrinase [Frigoribacterium sp. PhB116]